MMSRSTGRAAVSSTLAASWSRNDRAGRVHHRHRPPALHAEQRQARTLGEDPMIAFAPAA
jgi:hypothetical protein